VAKTSFRSADDRLVDYLYVRLGRTERASLEKLAAERGESLSAVARRALLRGLLSEGEPEEQQSEERT